MLDLEKVKERSREVHGDEFEILEFIPAKESKTKKSMVKVRCSKRHISTKAVNHHFNGHKCRDCYTENAGEPLEYYQNKSKKIHGDRFVILDTFHLFRYGRKERHLKIRCDRGHVFTTTPKSHYKNLGGCVKCNAEDRKYTLDDIREKSYKVHGDNFEVLGFGPYREYSGENRPSLNRICKNGHKSNTSMASHFEGKQCIVCRQGEPIGDTKEYIRRARVKHGDKYNYDKTAFTLNKNKVIITCPKHGEFLQRADSHLEGRGCGECGGLVIKRDLDDIKKRLKELYGDIYTYDFSNHKNMKGIIKVICKWHGEFITNLISLSRGSCCTACTLDWDLPISHYVYLARVHSEKEQYCYKIGMSRIPERRVKEVSTANKTSVSLVKTWRYRTQREARDNEAILLKNLEGFETLSPVEFPEGWSETSITRLNEESMIKLIESIIYWYKEE